MPLLLLGAIAFLLIATPVSSQPLPTATPESVGLSAERLEEGNRCPSRTDRARQYCRDRCRGRP